MTTTTQAVRASTTGGTASKRATRTRSGERRAAPAYYWMVWPAVIAFAAFLPELQHAMNLGLHLFGEANEKGIKEWKPDEVGWAKVASVVAFGLLGALLLWVGARRERPNGVA